MATEQTVRRFRVRYGEVSRAQAVEQAREQLRRRCDSARQAERKRAAS